MDCEKYDRIALDFLYEELDELTMLAAKRHLEQCGRCRDIHARLRVTREAAVVPLLDPPDGFEQRVLKAERGRRAELPLGQRLGRAISILAAYSMRPQLAMAALLLLMIGSSLLFLRARPGQPNAIHVTERGVPEADSDAVILPAPKPPAAETTGAAAAQPSLAAKEALPNAAGGEPEPKSVSALAGEPRAAAGSNLGLRAGAGAALGNDALGSDFADHNSNEAAAEQALESARATQQSSGCAAAAPRFDEVSARYPATRTGYDATWRAAECRRALGEAEAARQGYNTLLGVAGYRERALSALESMGASASAGEEARHQGSRPAKRPASKPASSSVAK